MEKIYYIGLDVGSTTAKIAVIDSDNRVIYSKYERHNARVNELVSQYFDEILALTGDAEARICVTGSVGMATAEQLQAEFVQEVVAASVYARTAHPEAKALIDIGGEDAKVIFFKENGNMELRMNGNCAGGTGAFIDQMSVLMGVENQKMSEVAMKFGGKDFRADILVYRRDTAPLMVVECKREDVQMSREVLEQALRYNLVLNVKYVVITNGLKTFGFARDGESYSQMKTFPDWETMQK